MESKEKELYLKMLRVEDDLESMDSELFFLIEKYPQDMNLKNLKNQNKIFYESSILKKFKKIYFDKLRNTFSLAEFENILEESDIELEKIKKWLKDVAKEYLKNNFKQEELRNYWFGSYEDMPVIIESGE
ncbi:hypothetical protein [Fusobacterium periodonticum]|uniref:Uncharacterized protein n=1 Tax=Fusobacterium periodonticum 1_1_41FAA TaxID=469621 RepID=D6LHV5_9FUSO|nr:hypothetical protein [Fusobacterium periodonticum]EFG27981.1 hypothetical protein HMPREF0400_01315 [Fusobacterium periodonticum 1_1_41FAA]